MQTVVDLADILDQRGIERAIEQTEVLQLFDLRALEACLPGRRGAPIIRAILATYTGDTVTKSDMEELFLAICREYGIPQPLVNFYVEGDERDFVWPAQRVIVETDGRATHRTRAAFERDRAKDQRAVVAGWRVLRFTWRQLTETPAEVAAYTSSIVSASSPTSRNFV